MEIRRRDIVSYEMIFVLFLFSGAYKSAPYLNWVPIDLTFLFGVTLMFMTLNIVLKDGIKISSPAQRILALYIIFTGYAVITGIWSPSEEYYLSKAFRLGTATAIALGAPAVIIASSRHRIRRLGGAVTMVSFIVAIETIYQFLLHGPWELVVFGTNYLITGRVMGFGIILGFYYVLIERPTWRNGLLVTLLTIIMTGALGFSGARGPLVTTFGAVGLIVLASIRTGNLSGSRRAITAYGIGIIGTFVGMILVADQVRGIRRLLALLDGPGSSLGTRFDYWIWTIDLLGEANLLLGYGLGSWPLYIGFPDEQRYPHNIILEIIFETGIIGLILFTVLVGYAMYAVVTGWRQTKQTEYIALFALFAYMLVNAFISGDLNENRYLFAIIGLMAYSPRHQVLLSKIGTSIPKSHQETNRVN